MAGVILASYLSFALSVILLIAGLYNYRKEEGLDPRYFFVSSGIFFVLGAFSLLYFMRLF